MRARALSVIAVMLCSWLSTTADAQQFDWTGAVNTTYSTPGNWSPTGPPGPAATARFNLATSYNISFTANATVDAISVNNGSVTWNMGGFTYNAPNLTNSGIGGSLTVRIGTFTAGGLSVGSNPALNSTLTLDQSSTITVGNGGFSVGSGDTGFLIVRGFSTFTTANATTLVGANPTGFGNATVVGSGSSWIANGTVKIGTDGTGTVNVLNGGTMTAAAITVGEGAFANATLTVSGLGAMFTTAGTANIGGSVALGAAAGGTLALGPGATVNFNGTTNLRTTATLNLTGGTLNVATLNIETGAAVNWTAGRVNFANASTVTGPVLATFLGGTNTLGANRTLSAASGTLTLDTPLTVNGGTVTASNVTVAAPLVVGAFGTVSATDTVTVNTGQTVQVSDLGTLATTNPMFNNGVLQLNGPAAKVNGFAFNLGLVQGTGRFAGGMNNSTLGTIRARTGDYLVIETAGLTNSGNIELSGGVLEYTKPISNLNTGFISGRGEFRAGTSTPGGAGLANSGVVAFSGGTSDVRGDVQNNPGGVIVSGGGGVVTFYDDVIHNGAEIRTNGGSRSVFLGGVSGAGPFTGTGVVEFNGDLRPGNSPAQVSVGGDVELGSSSGLHIELGGLNAGSEFDQLLINGNVAISGSLVMHLINGYIALPGTSYNILRFGGTRTGDFSSIQNQTGYAGLRFLRNYGANGLTITSYALPGDANLSGFVDLTDFTFLAANFNGSGKNWLQGDFNADGTVDLTDFTFLAANFNTATPPSQPLGATVPEPALAGWGALALIGMARRRRIRETNP
jgi:T5SS/PEP-CTERM-associated repeat protein